MSNGRNPTQVSCSRPIRLPASSFAIPLTPPPPVPVTTPGTTDGTTLRLKGQGMPGGKGQPSGDAYVEIRVQPHAFFQARDNDIHAEVPVTLREAVLGGRIKVPTVAGSVMLNVPAGSNSGTTLRLKGRGLLDRKSGQRGDQYVKLKVVLPDKPDDKLKAFLDSWEAGKTQDPRQAMEQFT